MLALTAPETISILVLHFHQPNSCFVRYIQERPLLEPRRAAVKCSFCSLAKNPSCSVWPCRTRSRKRVGIGCGLLRFWGRRCSYELLDLRRLLGNHCIPRLQCALDGFGTSLIHGHCQQVFPLIQGKIPALAVVRDMIPARRRGICSSRFGRGGHGRRHVACVRHPVCDNSMKSWL